MAIKIALLLLAGAAAEQTPPLYPFEKNFPEVVPPVPQKDVFGLPIAPAPIDYALRHPVCSSEESFFKHDLSMKKLEKNQVDFHFKGANADFVGVDVPFSHEANAMSMSLLEEENAQEGEKVKLSASPKMKHMLESADTELQRTEE